MDQMQKYNSVKCPNCGTIYPDECKFCPQCGKERNSTETQPSESMKWYKFVIWVQLFLNALINLVNGIRYITGTVYGDSASMVYLFYNNLKALDVFMGVICIGAAVLAIIARQALAQYKKNGPLLYYACWIVGIALNLIYIFGLGVVGVLNEVGSQAGSQVGTSIGISAVMLVVNITYFKKRMHLFVN